MSKAITCMRIYLYKQKLQFYQGDRYRFAILLYERHSGMLAEL